MQKITPHLWFDREARQAAALYTSLFEDGRVTGSLTLRDTPSGDADVVTIELAGQQFTLLNGGPLFTFNPSISFLVACASREEVDRLWEGLAEGGTALMELGEYPFSPWFGWVQDRFGLSWQVMHAGDRPMPAQKITPMLLFVGPMAGRAEEAIRFWVSTFRDAAVGEIDRYGEGEAPDQPGTVRQAEFTLEGHGFRAMDSAHEHKFAFNEAISLMVRCRDQAEIDDYWAKLSADPEAEQCGWLKDRFGVSWQVTPIVLEEMMRTADQAALDRVTQAFLPMKKLDIATLEAAYEGRPS